MVAIDALFFGLSGAALLVFRHRERRGRAARPAAGSRMPGHPVTTLGFTGAFLELAVSTLVQFPRSAGIGVLILVVGAAVYGAWAWRGWQR